MIKKKNKPDNLSIKERAYFEKLNNYINRYKNKIDLVNHFPLFIPRQKLIYYLTKYELFKKIFRIKGSIIECGSHKGSSLLLFAKLSAIFEPYDIHKKIISFDTFSGFPAVSKRDKFQNKEKSIKNYLNDTDIEELKKQINFYDQNRPNSHLEKIELIKGDATRTIPNYVKKNKHLLISLLYLDFDLYKPTKVALDFFLQKMSPGGIIAFDELNQNRWPGETIAYLENKKIRKYKLKKFDHEPNISYIEII